MLGSVHDGCVIACENEKSNTFFDTPTVQNVIQICKQAKGASVCRE
jgi:hypothetical protein